MGDFILFTFKIWTVEITEDIIQRTLQENPFIAQFGALHTDYNKLVKNLKEVTDSIRANGKKRIKLLAKIRNATKNKTTQAKLNAYNEDATELKLQLILQKRRRRKLNASINMVTPLVLHHMYSDAVSRSKLEKKFFEVSPCVLNLFSILFFLMLLFHGYQIFKKYKVPTSNEIFRTRDNPKIKEEPAGCNNMDLIGTYSDVMWALTTLSDSHDRIQTFMTYIM